MKRPIAVATPVRDPAADVRSRLRRADNAYRAAQVAVREARAELAREVAAATDAGLSHRQIAYTLDRKTMTVWDLEQAGHAAMLDLRREA